jgi:cation:H+ antiporter
MSDMWLEVIILCLSLGIILISCELFTNGIEWFGKKLRVGDGVVGSVFSAVGTCLPETMIPIIAILFSTGTQNSEYVGIGAIVGAPFMLSTLAFFISGLSVFVFWKRRRTGMAMKVNSKILKRDIGFFILVYSMGISVSFINIHVIKYMTAIFLIVCYIYYIILTVKNDHESHSKLDPLYTVRLLKVKTNMFFILLQIAMALSGIIFGAKLFVSNIENVSSAIGVSILALSLVITPVATELPEKFNSIIWIRKKKDTLAMGNITGAMVFQSCIPVSIGILATRWEYNEMVVVSALMAISSATVTYLWLRSKGKLTPIPLLAGGVFYSMFIAFLVMRGAK